MNVKVSKIKRINIERAGSFFIAFGKIKTREFRDPIYAFGIDLDRGKAVEKCEYEGIERYFTTSIENQKIYKCVGNNSNNIDPYKLFSYSSITKKSYSIFGLSKYKDTTGWFWTIGEDISTHQDVFLPIDYIFVGLGRNLIARKRNIPIAGISNSSGCAIQEDKFMARRSALLELIERDNILLWWNLGLKVDKVRYYISDSKKYKDLLEFEEYKKRVGLESNTLAISLDFGITTFVTILEGEKKPFSVFGFGCEMDPLQGLIKSMKEATFIHAMICKKYFSFYTVRRRDQVKNLADHGMYFAMLNRKYKYRNLLNNCSYIHYKDFGSTGNINKILKRLMYKGNLYEYIYHHNKRFTVSRLISDYLIPLNSSYKLRSIRSERLEDVYKKYGKHAIYKPGTLNPLPHPIY